MGAEALPEWTHESCHRHEPDTTSSISPMLLPEPAAASPAGPRGAAASTGNGIGLMEVAVVLLGRTYGGPRMKQGLVLGGSGPGEALAGPPARTGP